MPSQQDAHSVINSIRKIVQGLRVSSRRIESDLGISGAQLFVLQKIFEANAALSIGEIAALTLTHISSVSVVVSKLTELDLVRKEAAPDDLRRTVITISSKGLKLLGKNTHTVQEGLITAIQTLPLADRKNLADLLERVVKIANLDDISAPMFFEDTKSQKK